MKSFKSMQTAQTHRRNLLARTVKGYVFFLFHWHILWCIHKGHQGDGLNPGLLRCNLTFSGSGPTEDASMPQTDFFHNPFKYVVSVVATLHNKSSEASAK